jgi:uncharacterized protein
MRRQVNRRAFLKSIPVASGVLASAGPLVRAAAATEQPAPVQISSTPYTPVADYPIHPKRFYEVTLADNFWKPKVTTNAEVTIPFEAQKFAESRRTLTGNVLEAAMMSLRTHPNPELQAQVDTAIQAIASKPGEGNGGFEVAATCFETTGRRELLDRAIRNADALYEVFTRSNPPFSGGERDAINCLQLYRSTRDKKHLDLAKHYLDIRGLENSVNRSRHNQSYKPVLEQSEAVGHAVNCASLMVSLADVGVLTGLNGYLEAAQRMWLDAVTHKMYVTGGIGSTGNEGFGERYSLPNISAYSETCAVLMFITLNHRLFLATGDGRYIDVMERGMYNNAIDGVSAGGDHFFYVNRLASAGDGRDQRWQRASLECCPPNLVRFLASMPGLIYAQDERRAIYVNLYVSSECSFKLADSAIALTLTSDMPWSGASTITVATPGEVHGAIKLRIPGWARNQPAPGSLYSYLNPTERQSTISVNKANVNATPDKDGYVTIERVWKSGDTVIVNFPMEIRRVAAHAAVKENRGRMAIERGPIVYCAEWPESEGGHAIDLICDPRAAMTTTTDPNFFGGVTLIKVDARQMSDPSSRARPITLIPYFLWANRGPGEMSVWISHTEYALGDIGPAGGFIFYINPNVATDGWRYLEAAPADQSAGAKWGCFRNAIAGAGATAIGAGRQNTRDMLAACNEPGTAAELCASYRLNGVGGWFLPSRDELAALYRNLHAQGVGGFQVDGVADNVSFWASSQLTADMASHIDFADNGRQHFDDKDFPRRVRAIRAF